MWIYREVLFDYFQDYYGDRITIDGIKKSCKMLKVNLTPEQIEKWLKQKAKEDKVNLNLKEIDLFSLTQMNESLLKRLLDCSKTKYNQEKYSLDKIDYNIYVESLDIYIDKCFKLCEIFEMLANPELRDEKLIKYFDITIDGEDILRDDVDRLALPLITNYKLALETYITANMFKTYLTKIEKPIKFNYCDLLPKEYLLNDSEIYQDEFVALTSKQREEKYCDEDELFQRYRFHHEDDDYEEWLNNI